MILTNAMEPRFPRNYPAGSGELRQAIDAFRHVLLILLPFGVGAVVQAFHPCHRAWPWRGCGAGRRSDPAAGAALRRALRLFRECKQALVHNDMHFGNLLADPHSPALKLLDW